MGISEKKMQIVINNYFKKECDVNTSIREAFEKGFKIGVKKGLSAQSYTNADIQKIQDIEQAQFDTVYQIGVEEGLQSAMPKRPKGEWITSDDMYETGVCSVCKCDSQEPVSYTIMMFKFCPNCGAKMEG